MFHFLFEKQAFEILLVCILSGVGMIYSGHVLEKWQLSNIFNENDELWIIITPLLGLKGNLEMTLACRLSTMIKLGEFKTMWTTGYSNLLIIQVQSLLVGLGVAFIGFSINALFSTFYWTFVIDKLIRLIFVSVLTASISSFILGIVTIMIVYNSWKLHFDPDNIATPLAAAMGDTITLFVFYSVSTFCPAENVNLVHYFILLVVFLFLLPFLLSQVTWNELPVWTPIFVATILSSMSGWILKNFVFSIKYLATFQPLVNGVGGNIGSIFCSSLSTNCHRMKKFDDCHYDFSECKTLFGPFTFFGVIVHCVLLLLCALLQLIPFANLLRISCPYLIAVACQILFLLIASKTLVQILWKNNINPDNGSIPLITGFGDLLGTLLLSMSLSFVN